MVLGHTQADLIISTSMTTEVVGTINEFVTIVKVYEPKEYNFVYRFKFAMMADSHSKVIRKKDLDNDT